MPPYRVRAASGARATRSCCLVFQPPHSTLKSCGAPTIVIQRSLSTTLPSLRCLSRACSCFVPLLLGLLSRSSRHHAEESCKKNAPASRLSRKTLSNVWARLRGSSKRKGRGSKNPIERWRYALLPCLLHTMYGCHETTGFDICLLAKQMLPLGETRNFSSRFPRQGLWCLPSGVTTVHASARSLLLLAAHEGHRLSLDETRASLAVHSCLNNAPGTTRATFESDVGRCRAFHGPARRSRGHGKSQEGARVGEARHRQPSAEAHRGKSGLIFFPFFSRVDKNQYIVARVSSSSTLVEAAGKL